MKREKVVGKDLAGNEVVVFIRQPNAKEKIDASIHASAVFNNARKAGAMLREEVDEYMRTNGLWSKAKEERLFQLEFEIEEILENLKKGKNGGLSKLSDARKAAIRVGRLRMERFGLLLERRRLDLLTANALSEDAKHHFLSSCCILNEEGERLFKSLDEYEEKADEPYVEAASGRLAALISGYVDDWEKKLPENEFLIKYGFLNSDLQLVNKEGKLVDENFKEVDVSQPVVEFAEFDNDLT